MVEKFLLYFLAAGLVMKYNLDWHRKLLIVFMPLFLISMLLQTVFIVYRLRKEVNPNKV